MMCQVSCVDFYDALAEIQKERERLEVYVYGPDFCHNTKNWGWMIGWLAKTNEDHLFSGKFISLCSVCGVPQKHLVRIDFSCDEYSHEIKICKQCLESMNNTYKYGFKNREQAK